MDLLLYGKVKWSDQVRADFLSLTTEQLEQDVDWAIKYKMTRGTKTKAINNDDTDGMHELIVPVTIVAESNKEKT
jgi:hypothetical protein